MLKEAPKEEVVEVDVKDQKTQTAKTKTKPVSSITPLRRIKQELTNIINANLEDDGWAYWSLIAQLLQKKFPGFHPRNYGDNTRTLQFFEKMKEFEVKKETTVSYIRNKK